MNYPYSLLPTDFKDDIINEGVNQKRKYRMIQNDDGTVSLEDATEYLQKGTLFGGNNINKTNEQINNANYELRHNIYPIYTENIFVCTELKGILRWITVTKLKYREETGNISDEFVENISVEDRTENFSLDLKPQHIYQVSIDIREIFDKYKKSKYDKMFLVWLELYSIREAALCSQLSFFPLEDGNNGLIQIIVCNFSDSTYHNFKFERKFKYNGIIQTKMENLRNG